MKKTGFLAVILLVMSFSHLFAGPTVIRDNRVKDIATTPVLGRGYSIGTNTYQSTCLKKVVITEPSYDMEYTFDSFESSKEETSKKTKESKVDAALSYKRKVKVFGSRSSRGLDWALSTGEKSTVIDNVTYYNHKIVVTIDLYSYYASVDESQSQMSDTAKELLANNDLPGFFNSCGAYYVRSIGRKAKFISIFNYRTRSTERDKKFESSLKSQIKSFRSGTFRSWFGAVKGSVSLSTSLDIEKKRQEEFNSQATQKHLTITTHAYGLGRNKDASLISYDLDSFKAAIKDAFISMQNPRTGKVATIEVVPWVENTEFQSAVRLEDQEVAVEGDGEGKKEKLYLYEKKHILTQNAEFFIEVERADRNLMNMYYKAKLCRKNIDANWKKNGNLMPEYRDAMVVSNRDGSLRELKKLDQELSDEKIKQLLDNEKVFMYGKKSGGTGSSGGAAACIREIMKQGVFKKSYRDIKACEPVLGQMGDVQGDFVNDFCMPVLQID